MQSTAMRDVACDEIQRPTAVRTVMLVIVLGCVACSASAAAAEMAGVVPRSAWKAKPGKTAIMKRQTPREIIIHMTGVRMQPRVSLERKMRGLQSFSQRSARVGKRRRPAWGDVPYHYYIGASGRFAKGRDIAFQGDSNTRYSLAGRIQVVVEGDFRSQKPRPEQLRTLTKLTRWLAKRYGIAASKISGHNDHAATSCPGPNLKSFLPRLRAAVAG
ncbi:MAG: peptidoglycan recognition family protein [Pseudomonadota bacterium]